MSLDRLKKLIEQGSPISIKKQFPKIKEIVYYDTKDNVDFRYVRLNKDTFRVEDSLYPKDRQDFEKELDNEHMLLTVIQSLNDYSVKIEGNRLILIERENVTENYETDEEEHKCYNCKFYSESEHLCDNPKAFSINKDYPMLRDFDNIAVVIKDANLDKIMIPYNFGCIHWTEK